MHEVLAFTEQAVVRYAHSRAKCIHDVIMSTPTRLHKALCVSDPKQGSGWEGALSTMNPVTFGVMN